MVVKSQDAYLPPPLSDALDSYIFIRALDVNIYYNRFRPKILQLL